MSAAELRAKLSRDGWAVLPAGALPPQATIEPWAFVEALFGERPDMVERQIIRAVPSGRSYASSSWATPPHTDSQSHLGLPPTVQIMTCIRPAERGGESLLVDAWQLLDRIEAHDPELYRSLFTERRRMRFVFGDVEAPTVALRGARLVVTHPPVPPCDDTGRRFAAWLERAAPREVRLAAGEVLVVDNERMLHGRRAFDDVRRELWRVLCWLPHPLSDGGAHAARALELAGSMPSSERMPRELRAVIEMLTGTSPGKLAAREQVTEPTLYAWRNAALQAAAAALAGLATHDDDGTRPR